MAFLRVSPVDLRATESIVVLNQGERYVEGFLARKPDECGSIELELEATQSQLKSLDHDVAIDQLLVAVPWDGEITRGIALKETGTLVEVFLIDYGIRECCSKINLYLLPEKFQRIPGYGLRIDLDAPIEACLKDEVVTVTCLERRDAISATGRLVQQSTACNSSPEEDGSVPEIDPQPVESSSCHDDDDEEEQEQEEAESSVQTSANKIALISSPCRPPNELLLHMIGAPSYLMELLVMRIESENEMLCSHFSSINAVMDALDKMDELPSRVVDNSVPLNMLVLVLSKSRLRRGIVSAILPGAGPSYQVELIDEPGLVEPRLLYHCPAAVANSAPRALVRIKLFRSVKSVEVGKTVTFLCCRIVDETSHGYLIRNGSPQAATGRLVSSNF